MPLREALAMVAAGGIKDSKTIAGLALTALFLAGDFVPE
jgi:hypothetical protein